MAAAVVLPVEAWANITALSAFDAGNSKTNSFYWIATRPNKGDLLSALVFLYGALERCC